MMPASLRDSNRRRFRVPIQEVVTGANGDLTSILEQMHYLGPLRAPAERYYIAGTDAPPTMDSSGEFLPFVLRDQLSAKVKHVPPGELAATEHTLGEAVDLWLRYLRTGVARRAAVAGEVRVRSRHEALVELEVRSTSGGGLHEIVNSGFGYSQVLPILIKVLLAPTDSMILIEQPEVHLNSSLQVRLAEFLAGAVVCGKQVIVETHSEHIVNTLRVLVANRSIRRYRTRP